MKNDGIIGGNRATKSIENGYFKTCLCSARAWLLELKLQIEENDYK